MALGVVYYFVAGRSSTISSEAREPYDLKELPVENDKP
jgi:hypothetical protein